MQKLLPVCFLMLSICCIMTSCINTRAPLDTSELKPFGMTGKAVYILEGGVEAELFAHEGKGIINHMWFGGNNRGWNDGLGNLKIRIYVDGEEIPSIDMSLFMGHGIGFLDPYAPWGNHRIGKTGWPGGLYNSYRIPFGKSIRVTGQIPNGEEIKSARFWYTIGGTENMPVEFSGVTLPDNARLKLYKLENYNAKSMEEFNMCLLKSNSGMLYQVAIAAQSTGWGYLESTVRAYVDKSEKPLLLSSGLEDYFLGTYYFNRGRYVTPMAGLTHFEDSDHSFSAFRLHEEDPLFFSDGLRLTLVCGEKTERESWAAPPTNYTTYVWVYEW